MLFDISRIKAFTFHWPHWQPRNDAIATVSPHPQTKCTPCTPCEREIGPASVFFSFVIFKWMMLMMWLSYLDALSPGCVVAAPVSPFYPAMVQSKKLNTCLYCCSSHIPPPTAHNGAVPKKLDKQLDITLAAGLGHIVLVSNITYGR